MDLWPQEIDLSDHSTPLSVLSDQAALLSEKTEQLVTAKIKDHNSRSEQFEYQFFIECNVLHFSRSIFTIQHDIDVYPVVFFVDIDILLEISRLSSTNHMKFVRNEIHVDSETDFIDLVSDILKSEKMQKLIKILKVQAKYMPDSGMNYDEIPF